MSKRESVKLLKEKIQRVFSYYPMGKLLQNKEMKLWKNFDLESFLQNKNKFDENQTISLKNNVLLDDQTNLEVYILINCFVFIFCIGL